jgi:signal transduction histidine kinase
VSAAAAHGATHRLPRALHDTLAVRMILASAILAAIIATVFLVLLLAMSTLRDATTREARAKDVTAATLALEKLVADLETGLRGYALTGEQRFLDPWTQALRELPARAQTLERLAQADPEQQRRARAIGRSINAYIVDHGLPLIAIAQENRAAARAGIAGVESKRRTDGIRAQFRRFLRAENARAAASASSADDRSELAIALGVSGLFASAGLIVLFGLLQARSIARPVRDVAEGATRLAGGDLSLRLDEGGPGEVGELTRAFNTMAEALDQGRTELEEQNARLRQSEQLKSELVSIVSHEVRTPLASVLGFTSLLLQRDVDPQTRRDYLEIIDAQGRRLATLLDDFLNVQRIEEGRLELAAEVVDMKALLREQTQLFRAQSPAHELELRVPSGPLPVLGDAGRLAQVLGNLLSNAIKYSPDGGVVQVVGERDGSVVQVSVRDEGLGIPEEQHDRIFTKFFRGDAAASGIAGTGLGLAFAQAIVEAHGGRIAFRSTAGEGSTFWIELPLAHAVR